MLVLRESAEYGNTRSSRPHSLEIRTHDQPVIYLVLKNSAYHRNTAADRLVSTVIAEGKALYVAGFEFPF